MIKAEIVADSLSPQGDRLVSVLCTFPRIILAEVNTHRMLSKNTASSRAIPFAKMLQSVKDNPFIPIAFQKDHKGMQGTEYFTEQESKSIISSHLAARNAAVDYAETQYNHGVTKQICNRYLEPFMWTTMVITGPLEQGWDNFFNLRCPKYRYIQDSTGNVIYCKSKKDWLYEAENVTARVREHNRRLEQDPLLWFKINEGAAEIHMMALAECIWDAFNESTPKQLKAGDWHIPWGDKIHRKDIEEYLTDILHLYTNEELKFVRVKVSTSMGARTSYTVVGEEKDITIKEQVKLHDRLIAQNPPHSSPMEHCAKVMTVDEYSFNIKGAVYGDDLGIVHDKSVLGWCRNFKGFIPYRHIIETNNN